MKSCIVLLFLVTLFTYAQTTKITYTVQIDTAAAGLGEQYRAEHADRMNKTLNDVLFALIYDSSVSKFYTYEVRSLNQAAVNEALGFVFADRPIYNYRGDKYEHGAKGLAETDFLVKTKIPEIILHNDTLTINGYKCYKASLSYHNGSTGITDFAWYCLDIKGGFGPVGLSGFPGAVLMYQRGYITFKVKEVIPKLRYKVDFPSKMKVLSEDEYLDLWRRWEEKEMGIKD